MITKVFYVEVREDYQKDRMNYFPYIASTYVNISKNFEKEKRYPVLAVRHTTLISDDEKNVETAQFLVPTESGNFLWVLSEIFQFAGMQDCGE